ncbi:MAG TPA: sulfurtransferase TusA family protein [Methylomirabilota bacterium]|jgi:tRNA 2-thiouridine synthesizing protein A|nr:sulfurtransferase TusA family protein [Methylomirabilota bacterium]
MTEYRTVDARGLKCPMPIVRAKKEIDAIPVGEILRVVATDPGSVLDFQGWVKTSTKYELVKQEEGRDEQGRATFVHLVRRKA